MDIQYRHDLGGAISARPGWDVRATRQELMDLAYAINASLRSVEDKTLTAETGNYTVSVTDRGTD